jgi:hypothetical protein
MLSLPSRLSSRVSVALALLIILSCVLLIPIAEGRALEAEEAYVADRLENASCLSDWGTSEGAGPSKDASITKVTTHRLQISVTLPYAYTTEAGNETMYADFASEAVYEVSPTRVQRIRGDDISPC